MVTYYDKETNYIVICFLKNCLGFHFWNKCNYRKHIFWTVVVGVGWSYWSFLIVFPISSILFLFLGFVSAVQPLRTVILFVFFIFRRGIYLHRLSSGSVLVTIFVHRFWNFISRHVNHRELKIYLQIFKESFKNIIIFPFRMSFCAQPWLVHVPELNPISKEKSLQLLRSLILIQDHGKDHNMDLGKDHKFNMIFQTSQGFKLLQYAKVKLSFFLFRFSLNGNIKPIPPPLISVDTSHRYLFIWLIYKYKIIINPSLNYYFFYFFLAFHLQVNVAFQQYMAFRYIRGQVVGILTALIKEATSLTR